MKRFLILLMLLVPMIAVAEDTISINGVEEPQWKDFAPKAFVDVKEPKGLGRFNDTAAYWYKRRVQFQEEIEKCRAQESSDSKFSCYQNLKVVQYQKNSDYNARLEAIEESKRMSQEMQDPTTNMLPIGGYINNFSKFQPNELR